MVIQVDRVVFFFNTTKEKKNQDKIIQNNIR